MLRRPIYHLFERLINSQSGKAKIGPIGVELGKLAENGQHAVSQLNRLNHLMSESRLLELEITEKNFAPVFSDEQRSRMKQYIEELKLLTNLKRNSR